MNVLKIRSEMRNGKTIFDLPLRVTFYARVSTDKDEQINSLENQSAAGFHNRYPYSGKIICEEHGTSFHRQVLKSSKGEKEVWQCRVYRNRGRAACSAPQLRTAELDQIMAQIFDRLAQSKKAIIDAVVSVLQSVPDEHDYTQDIQRIKEGLSSIQAKKDRLLEMSIEGVISTAEFKQRNDGFNEQVKALEAKRTELQAEAEKGQRTAAQLEEIRTALERELTFQNGVNSALVTTILDHIVVKTGSTKEELHLEIHLKFGDPYRVVSLSKSGLNCREQTGRKILNRGNRERSRKETERGISWPSILQAFSGSWQRT